jgi:hypothetical protein
MDKVPIDVVTDHRAQAAAWLDSAGQWRDFDRYDMDAVERAARRAGDLAQAHVHATLAAADELAALREMIAAELTTLGSTIAGQYRG